MLTTPTIKYVAAPPGTGKTRAAIELMRKHVLGKYDRANVHYIFYVAPTVDLLRQTLHNLKAALPANQHSRLHLAFVTKFMSNQKVTISRVVQSVLDGTPLLGVTPAPFRPGSILFMTHEAFIRLRKHDTFTKTLVLFDEARKWSTMFERLVLTPEVEAAFNTMFTCTALQVGKSRYPDILRVTAKRIPPNQMVKRVLGTATQDEAKAFKRMHDLHEALSGIQDGDELMAPRLQSFAVRQGTGDRRSIIQIALPSEPFRGFYGVYILSADFMRSQMHYLLKEENCKVVDSTAHFMNEHSTGLSYGEALSIIHSRYQHLSIVPLTQDSRSLSKTQLISGILVPEEKTQAFLALLTELDLSTLALRRLAVTLSDPDANVILTDTQLQVKAFVEQHGLSVNPFHWYVTQATRVAIRWMKQHGRPRPGLLLVNKEQESYGVNPQVFDRLSHAKAEGRNDFQTCNVVAFLAAINPPPTLARLLNILLGHHGYDADEDHVVDKAIQCIGRGNIRNHESTAPMLAIVSSLGLANKVVARMEGSNVLTNGAAGVPEYRAWDGYAASRAKAAARREQQTAEERRAVESEYNKKRYSDPDALALKKLRAQRTYWRKTLAAATTKDKRVAASAKLAELDKDIDALETKR